MTDPVKMIEQPAKRPRPWMGIITGFGALFWIAIAIGAAFEPVKPGEVRGPMAAFFSPALPFAFFSVYLFAVSRRGTMPFWYSIREGSETVRFRLSGPIEAGLVGWMLASFTSFMPVLAIHGWLGPFPPMLDVALAAIWMFGGYALFYVIARPFYTRGKRDLVIDYRAGTLSLPLRRIAGKKLPAVDVRLTDVRAVVIQSGGALNLTLNADSAPPITLGHSGSGEDLFVMGVWLASKLNVPLLQRSPFRSTEQKRVFRAKVRNYSVFSSYMFVLCVSWSRELEHRFIREDPAPKHVRPAASVPGFDSTGRPGSLITLTYDDRTPSTTFPENPPIILLHGSPGNGSELGRIAAPLQAAGYRVITPDLPGFGDSTLNPPSLSILAHAHEVLALMDQLHIQKAHILGWSLGGGVAMHIVDLAPDRVASLTLMASISDQESEGTRSYFAEHAKYALGYTAATVARYAIPHFGYLSHFDEIRASMINFWDTDMRPLQALMSRIKTPTLILHGRNDPLVPYWAAEHSHELIRPSTLVMSPYSHFFPFMQPDYAAAAILPFITRHDTPSPALRQLVNLSPEHPSLLGEPGHWAELQLRHAHWLTLIAAATVFLLYRRRTAAILLFLAVYFGLIDIGIAFGAIFAAQFLAALSCHGWPSALRRTPVLGRGSPESDDPSARPRTGVSAEPETPVARIIGTGISTRTESHWQQLLTQHPILLALASRFIPNEQELTIKAVSALGWPAAPRRAHLIFLLTTLLSYPLWTLFYLITTILSAFHIIQPLIDSAKLPGLILSLALTIPLIRSLELLLTTTGRRLLRIRFTRLTHREYWPSHLLYYPTAPYYIYLGLKHGPIAFTACNPGIEHGGGLIGESKQSILDAMPDANEWILKSVRIDRADPEQRTAQALGAIKNNQALNFPVILKPDSGYRGFAVKLARGDDDVRAYFRSMLAPAVIQQYHPGPQECGILWARFPPGADSQGGAGLRPAFGSPAPSSNAGFIFSITRKEFPILTGDGRHTFEQLIFRHKRFHAQAAIFLSRFADQRTRILAKGESLRLAESGNHCQGTLFRDGEDLITPELTTQIDAIAQGFRGGLDIGRFDVRYESDDLLRQGKGFAILELNGITGESTNIYDPRRSLWWAYATHFRQWRLMYELGAARMATGHKPMSVGDVFNRIRTHKQSRSGSALAD